LAKEKKRWKGKITEECQYGGPVKYYWTWSVSKKQAWKFIKTKYNREVGRIDESYVEMEVEEDPPE